ncbi:MAG: hypothetical protein JO250_11470, partial [Armatimonadetes bacterium]|nr:hypothetical protein [Armatimonadota bacterium]
MPARFSRLGRVLFAVCCVLLGSASVAHAAAPPYVWVEGEAPADVTPAAAKPSPLGVSWGSGPQVLSDGKWLSLSIDAAKVDQQVPTDGIVISYNVNVPSPASYGLWNRIGYEKVRSPFDWRVDNGVWNTVTPDQDTVDVADLQDWNPLGWLKMGTQPLSQGPHTLQIRLTKSKDDKGNWRNVQYASDALCLVAGPFHPSGRLRPDQTDEATDADHAAASHVFPMPAPQGPAQTALSLKGDWQIAADDELVVDDRTGPIQAAPNPGDLLWSAVPVPGDRNATRPDMQYVHRYWLRARVSVPAEAAGRSFYLHVPAENMIATVFVNGRQCGWTKTPYAIWDCDVTQAMKPGQVNEIMVGIKDPFYGLADASDAKHIQYTPYNFWHYNTTNQLDFPVLGRYETGLLLEPALVTAGKAYTSDVFALPSVKNKALGLEVTVRNPTAQDITVSVANAVVPLASGTAAKTFAPKDLTVPAGQDAVLKVSEGWPNPNLWWPDDPRQYNVITTLSVNGQPIDRRTTKFGFREWGWQGAQFTLNGVPWHGRADLVDFDRADAGAVQTWRKHGQTMERVWGNGYAWGGLDVNQALDFFDASGVPIRRTGIFDGEGAAGFYAIANPPLWDNYRAQIAAWIKGQRNHPSVFIWSLENEITFINGHVTGQDQITTDQHHKTAALVSAVDPTRPFMTDGGNALLDQSLPVYGGHYMEPPFQSLPAGAYDKASFAHRQVWPVTEAKPILLGEAYFANGNEPADFATVGGEAAFVGKAEARPAIGLVARMLSEGYRWNGVNFHFWMGGESDAYYNSWQPVAVLCRQWDSAFGSGQRVRRTLKLFNDTHDAAPVTLTWSLVFGGRTVARQTTVHHTALGRDETLDVTLPMPRVAARQDGQWILTLSRGGKQVFKDVRPTSVMNTDGGSAAASLASRLCPTPTRLAVYDPGGRAAAFLRARRVAFSQIAGLATLPAGAKVLLIGPDALTAAQSTSSALAAYAAGGRTVIVLEQKNPLKYQGLPGDMPPDANATQGDIAFGEDLDHPVLRGLQQRDFFTWGPDGTVYKNPYVKPTSGGRSLVQCDWRLQDTALASLPAGKGLLLLSQLLIGQKLASSPVAQCLLLNMIAYGAQYRQVFRPVSVAAEGSAPLIKALDATGLRYGKAGDGMTAIRRPGSIAVINATPANL